MKVILSHPTGNSFVRALAKELLDAGILEAFYTSIASFPGSFFDKLARYNIFAELKRRGFDPSLQEYTKVFPFWELGRTASIKIGATQLTKHEKGFFSLDRSYQAFDKFVAHRIARANAKNSIAVYAYEDGALETFLSAKALGIKCVYDLPIAYWETGRKLMNEEAIRLPEWERTLVGGVTDSPKKLQRKVRELELADIVIAPSQFVVDSLPNWASSKKIVKVPFGTPIVIKDVKSREEEKKD